METLKDILVKVIMIVITLMFAYFISQIIQIEENSSKKMIYTKQASIEDKEIKVLSYIDLSTWMYKNLENTHTWKIEDKLLGDTYSYNDLVLRGSRTIKIENIDYENNVVVVGGK